MLPAVSGQFLQMVVQGCHNPHVQQVCSSRCWRLRHLIRHNFFSLFITLEIQAVLCASLGLMIFNNFITLALLAVHFVKPIYNF